MDVEETSCSRRALVRHEQERGDGLDAVQIEHEAFESVTLVPLSLDKLRRSGPVIPREIPQKVPKLLAALLLEISKIPIPRFALAGASSRTQFGTPTRRQQDCGCLQEFATILRHRMLQLKGKSFYDMRPDETYRFYHLPQRNRDHGEKTPE
jgi:hypothetical protein